MRWTPSRASGSGWGCRSRTSPVSGPLEGFDFAFQPSADERLIRELFTGNFIAHGENVLIFGPPGVGKSHLAIGLGRKIVEQGHTVRFTTATALLAGGRAWEEDVIGTLGSRLRLYYAAPLGLSGQTLTGLPTAPPSCGVLAGGATVTRSRPARQEPAFTPLEQAAAAGVPTVRVGWLTRQQGPGKLETAHGRSCSRAVRRRERGTSRRPFAPTAETAVVGSRAASTLQTTCTD